MCLPREVKGATIQRIAAVVGNQLCLNFGLMFGITPAHMRLYQLAETPLNRPVDLNDATWLAGYLFLGAAVGSLVSGAVSQKFGAKSVLLLSGLLQICAWFCIHFAYDIVHVYSSRLAAGIAAGAAFAVLPIYFSEIAEDANSGALIASVGQWCSLGILIGFVLSAYLRYEIVPIVGICCSFVFTMTFPFIQESPYYYMRKGDVPCMEKSLRWFRGIRDLDDRSDREFLQELAEFKNAMQCNRQRIAECSMSRAYILKMCVIGLFLAVGAQFNGTYVILNYASVIISDDATVLFPTDINVLILAIMNFIGATVAVWIGQKASRKTLLIAALICALYLMSLSLLVTYGNQLQINPINAQWLPIGLLSLHMASASIALYPLATIIMAEVLPSKMRVSLSSAMLALSWFLVFLIIQYFYSFTALVGVAGCFWLLAGVCGLVAVVTWLLLPELRGKSLEELQLQMGYAANGNVAKITVVENGRITHDYI